ncbi:MAG: hypothetical protein U0P30_15470 [Vicinamibacterales bacterium]
MPYLRLVADRRGVEHTYLLHTPAPGVPTKVLYWYRTAPGLRIGRPALDDAAMRTLEEQHPDIDFDWQYILDMGAMTPVEVEAPLPPRKRKPRPPSESDDASSDDTPQPRRVSAPPEAAPPAGDGGGVDAPAAPAPDVIDDDLGPDLLAELLGRGIASSLRARHADLVALVDNAAADPAVKAQWHDRLAALDPDGWESPEAVLSGMAGVDAGVEALRRTVEQATGAA